MNAILDQLELNQSYFIQLVVFALFFFILSNLYFRPFLKLFEIRHKKTVEDRESAEALMQQAEQTFESYKRRLAEEKAAARHEYDQILTQAKREEAALLAHAREEAKKITQDAAESVAKQRDQLRKQLESDVEGLASGISERLLSRKVTD